MSNSKRENFAKELIFEIAKKLSELDMKACTLIAELKNFVIVANFSKLKNTTDTTNVTKTVMLAGVQFTKKEAYDMCQKLSKELYHICRYAECYCWSFDMWYALVEVMKMLGIQPNNEFTSFINCFLAVNIETTEASVDDSYEINLMKKLKIIHLLGEPK